jgi:two-component system, OmpR family, sensor kinase
VVVDHRDADAGVHDRCMPTIDAAMRPLRTRRPAAPDPGLLLRSVVHELRPSIAALSSLAKALDGTPADSVRHELARLTVEHATHAAGVLEQAAAAAGGRKRPAARPVPLGQVLPVALTAVPSPRLTVRTTRDAGLCLVHPSHTAQILVNLLHNAVSYSPPDGPILVRAWTSRRRLHLVVSDRGGPTPALALALRRRRPPRTDRGLGLWTVRTLLAEQGGSLRARPILPRGLAMVVRLPHAS